MTKDTKRAYIVLSIPLILCLLPSGIEASFAIFTGYKQGLPLFDVLALILILILPQRWFPSERRVFFIYGFVIFISSLLFHDNITARVLASIQFFIGFFLSKSFVITENTKKILKIVCFLLVLFVFFQQIVFSLEVFGVVDVVDFYDSESLGDGVFRAGTTVGTCNDTSHIMVILISILLYLSTDLRFKTLVIVMMFASVFISGCRGAQLMSLFPFLFFLYEVRHQRGLLTLVFIVIGLIYLVNYFHILELIQAREESVMAYGDVTSGRTIRWVYAFKEINKSFCTQIIGNGGLTIPHGMNYGGSKVMASPHNCYIGIIVEAGYIGFLCIAYFLFRKLWKIRTINYASLCLASVFIVSFNTEVIGLTMLPAFFYWLLYHLYLNN